MNFCEPKKLFNPFAKEDHKLVCGSTTNILDLSQVKYPFFIDIVDKMYANNWLPNKVGNMAEDKYQYQNELSKEDKEAFDTILSFLIFLDSIQTNNLPNIADYVTLPEVVYALARQTWEECLIEGHQVLKENGEWVDIKDIKEGDRILTYDPNTNSRKFDVVTKKYIYDYSGKPLHHFKSKYFEQITTENHRIPYFDRQGNFKVKYAKYFNEGNIGVDLIVSGSDNKNKTDGTVRKSTYIAPEGTKVYCVTVPSSYFIVKYNDKISVTGNSLHSRSYGYILINAVGEENMSKIIYKYKENEILLNRNKLIAGIYEECANKHNMTNFLRVLIANYLLEGLYFYNGFQFFHNLADRGFMVATDIQIKYIQRDELLHCVLFKEIIKIFKQEYRKYFDKELIYDMFKKAVDWEQKFSLDVIGDKIIGINSKTIIDYTYYLANKRLKDIGLEPIFPKTDNPYKHLDKIASVDDETTNRVNNFEATSITYKDPTILKGWDEI